MKNNLSSRACTPQGNRRTFTGKMYAVLALLYKFVTYELHTLLVFRFTEKIQPSRKTRSSQ